MSTNAIDSKTQAIIDEITALRQQLRAVAGTPAELAIANQLAVELSNLRAQDETLYKQAKINVQIVGLKI